MSVAMVVRIDVTASAGTERGRFGVAMPRPGVVAAAAFAVITIGATVVVGAAFLALIIGGGNGTRVLFALVAGSLAYAALVLVQFIHWAVLLLRTLRGRS